MRKFVAEFTGENVEVKAEHFSMAVKEKERPDYRGLWLENGTWLKAVGDGTYFDDSGDRWLELILEEIDADGEPLQQVYSFGFVRV